MSLKARPCLCWGLSHLWSVPRAAGLLQAPSSHQMTFLQGQPRAFPSPPEQGGSRPAPGARVPNVCQMGEGKTSGDERGLEGIDQNHNFMGVAINSQAKPKLQKSSAAAAP